MHSRSLLLSLKTTNQKLQLTCQPRAAEGQKCRARSAFTLPPLREVSGQREDQNVTTSTSYRSALVPPFRCENSCHPSSDWIFRYQRFQISVYLYTHSSGDHFCLCIPETIKYKNTFNRLYKATTMVYQGHANDHIKHHPEHDLRHKIHTRELWLFTAVQPLSCLHQFEEKFLYEQKLTYTYLSGGGNSKWLLKGKAIHFL